MSNGRFEDFDWLILLCALLAIVLGLLMLYSIEHVPAELRDVVEPSRSGMFGRQLIWAAFGLVVMAIACIVPFRYFESLATIMYALALILLLGVLFMPAVKGSHRWINIGGFNFQPGEFGKIAVIFMLARFLAEKKRRASDLRVLLVAGAIAMIPVLLILKEPDIGSSSVYLAILFVILYWRGMDESLLVLFMTPVAGALLTIYSAIGVEEGSYPFMLLFFIVLILVYAYRHRRDMLRSLALVAVNLAVIMAVPIAWKYLQPYQQKRVVAFLRPGADVKGAGWQVYQSKLAIGSGGFIGKKFLHGTHKLLAFLPERHSDFVYSVLSEEFGFLGSLAVIALFFVIIIRGLYLATKVKNRFASIAAVGICSYFAFHVLVNIGMTTGLIPVTGLPLPFLSYGGSSMIVSCFFIGVLLNFSLRFYEY